MSSFAIYFRSLDIIIRGYIAEQQGRANYTNNQMTTLTSFLLLYFPDSKNFAVILLWQNATRTKSKISLRD